MHSLLTVILSLLFFLNKPLKSLANPEDDFLKACPPSTCGSGSGSLQIRFPLRLRSAPPSCCRPGLELTCSGNDTILSLPSLPPFKVANISYESSRLTLDLRSWFGPGSGPCPLLNLSSLLANLTTPVYSPVTQSVSWARCSTKFVPCSGPNCGDIAGPAPSCFVDEGYFVYVVAEYEKMDALPRDCEVFQTGGQIPYLGWSPFQQMLDDFGERREVVFSWYVGDEADADCGVCESGGRQCGLDFARNQSFCIGQQQHHGSHVKIIAGTSTAGLLVLLSVSTIVLYVFRQSEKEKRTYLKVEKFLATYKTTKPTRYTYSGIKKITKRFSHKLGQGGFGSVYKGELPNGIPVAVKMLEKSKGDGDEFINEVSTIGRIHHFNVVRLLGFCSEGTRRALVYEFMFNESLEKFIFMREDKRSYQILNMEKLLEIATGIARGIEYLHQGCDQRILHFDIKPHNILLDHNFIPKVSDFGLAKLCSRDHSIITMTAARGTMGYIAPEIYSRNFGEVSYKSDVYSFGMLLFEMVSGKRTTEPTIEEQNEVYFPEWVYNRLISGEDLGLSAEMGKEENIAKKLLVVALWCIQLSPNDRPTMTRVIQLLDGDLESLQIPPKPFVSEYQDIVGSASGVEGKEICRSSCGSLHNISYPFRLKGDPVNCGDPSYELECDGNKTVVEILSGKYLVMNIFHENATIHIINTGLLSGNCNLPLHSLSISVFNSYQSEISDKYGLVGWNWATFVNCSKKIENNICRPIPCLSQNNRFVYVTSGYYVESLLPSCSYLTMVPVDDVNITTTDVNAFQILQKGFSLSWNVRKYTRSMVIHRCLRMAIKDTRDDMDGFTKFKKITYPFQFEYEFVECIKRSYYLYDGASALYRSALVFIVFLDIAAFLLVLAILGRFVFGTLTIYAFLAYQLWNLLAPIDTVERFLRNQKTLMPSRYAYTDIIAMTRHFKEKLGQGGFGSVYKGELPGGHLVAIKILGNSKCNGEEFTSEVATIGRIHHVNVVRLVGFCSEGSHRALIYEFMSNGSLDKYIFSSNGSNKHFTIEKLNEIALGVARGLDYLHQGCDMRILHFDIKPHNVLLDQNFNPKLSDFGLAKLYPKENSLVSAFAARGTIGYMAPELVSRSFGLISYKSDVYSFGMLLLEMAGGRRNVDNRAENSSQVYYPSWIYHQLEQTERLEFCNDIGIDNLERKLCKVGLWCIQMRASARPSMSKVVEMLEADGDTIDMPPKPFLFSSPTSSTKPSSVHPSLTEISTIYEDE